MRGRLAGGDGVLLADNAYARQEPPTLRAVRLEAPLRIDGQLDEPIYTDVPPISDFIQVEPREGAPATEKTEIWLAFDDDNVYIAFRCWESRPICDVAKEMRRDNGSIWNGDDNVAVPLRHLLRPAQRRSSSPSTPIGGRRTGRSRTSGSRTATGTRSGTSRSARFEGGWTVGDRDPVQVAALPARATTQVWGFNALRTNRWKNELSFLTPTPKARGQQGVHQASLAAHARRARRRRRARRTSRSSRTSISNATGTRTARRHRRTTSTGDFGVDVEVRLTQNLTADLTYNTDFAQVEADEQQVNLTRFSLFFPEKREFFLENQGTFAFGCEQRSAAGGDTPVLFYSRRIGLEGGPRRADRRRRPPDGARRPLQPRRC